MRIWTISDIHVDFNENAHWVSQLSDADFTHDVLILAGDVSHDFQLLQTILVRLRKKFARLFFVPGNHDLWIRDQTSSDSIEKFRQILRFCTENGIDVQPALLQNAPHDIRIIPVFSWYHLPDNPASLFLPKPGEDVTNRMWSDRYFIRWPRELADPVEFFLDQSKGFVSDAFSGTTISFSHFLPRQELMFKGAMTYDPERMKKYDRFPQFNFSRVAGSWQIDRFIRNMGSHIHVYGHQHINRDRIIDGVRYVAHCLGYPDERKRGVVQGIEQGLKRLL